MVNGNAQVMNVLMLILYVMEHPTVSIIQMRDHCVTLTKVNFHLIGVVMNKNDWLTINVKDFFFNLRFCFLDI